MYEAVLPLGLNWLEVSLICFAAVLVVSKAVVGSEAPVWSKMAAAGLIFGALAISAAEATQFMTNDEWGISNQTLAPNERAFQQVSLGAYKTGVLVAVPVVRAAEAVNLAPMKTRMLLKAAWWLSGTLLVAGIGAVLLRLMSEVGVDRPLGFTVAFAGLYLLPTTQLALKTVNYDLFSLGFAVLAILLCAEAVRARKVWCAVLALIVAALAAQEKLAASPILFMSMLVFVCMRSGAPRSSAALLSSVAAIALVVMVAVSSMVAYQVVGPSHFPDGLWWSVLDPLSSWSWIPLKFLLPIDVILGHRFAIGAICAVVWIVLLPITAKVVYRLMTIRKRLRVQMPPAGFSILLLLILGAGAAAAFLIVPYWSPFRPSDIPGSANSPALLNGIFLHTGAATWTGHFLSIAAYAVAVLVVAVPTALWVGIPAFLVTARSLPESVRLLAFVLLLGVVAYVLAAAFMLVPFANRYFNLCITALAIVLLLPVLATMKTPLTISSHGFIVGFFLVLAVGLEMLPFRPLYAAFRPAWMEYADAAMAEPGRLNPSWVGWGEDVMRAGKVLEAACEGADSRLSGIPCQEITLYALHPGLWLPGPSKIQYVPYDQVPKPAPMDAKSFYVVNRSYLVQKVTPVPRIPPDFVIGHRGYALSWVWRGDRLKTAGYIIGN